MIRSVFLFLVFSICVTTIKSQINTFPYSESFESDFGDWTNQAGDDFDWTRLTGATASLETGSTGTTDGSYYIYTEASDPNYPNMEAQIQATFDFSSLSDPQLSFYYHMYGAAMGVLHVDVYDDSWNTDVLILSGQQHTAEDDPWTKATIDLSAYGELNNVIVRFRAITSTSWTSDFSIDNISCWDACYSVDPGDASISSDLLCGSGTVDLSLAGYDGGASLQWQVSYDNITFSDVSGATSDDETTRTLSPDSAFYYKAKVTNTCIAYSDTVSVMVASSGGTSIPYSDGFESDLGGWSNSIADDFDWTRNSGGTTSTGTGPDGATEGSWYMYIETSNPNYPDKTAILSQTFDFSTAVSPVLKLYYHMYGDPMGALYVDVNTDNAIWSISGQQQTSNAEAWTEVSVDLSDYAGVSCVSIRLRGVSSSDYTSDISIDDMIICESVESGNAMISQSVICGSGTVELIDTGYSDGATFQWQMSDDNVTFSDVSGATDDTITTRTLNADSTFYFRLKVINSCTFEYSDTVSVIVSSGGGETAPYSEGFEADFGSWTNQSGDDMDWSRNSGETTSTDTGPDGATEGSTYLYMEASNPNFPSKTAILSQTFDLSASSSPVLKFYYHMFGADMGTLSVDVNTDIALWSISGQQHSSLGDAWTLASIDLSDYAGESCVTIIIRGVTGANFTSDISIDDIIICEKVEAGGSLISQSVICGSGTVELVDTGYDDGATFQWQISDDNVTFSNISGATDDTITTRTLSADSTFYFRVNVTSGSCSNYSNVVNVLASSGGGSTPPYNEGFETDLGGWANGSDDDFDWIRNSGATGSGGTGPTGATAGSWYVYIEASDPNYPNKTAVMSKTFDLSGASHPLMKFSYHMYGVTMGALYVDVNTDESVWSISGQQHTSDADSWTQAEVDLSDYVGLSCVTINFRGYTGVGFEGDISLDVIEMCDAPQTPAIVGSDSVCANASSSAYSVPAPTSSTYAWIITGGTANPVPGANDTNITVDWSASGMEGKVQVVENNGCTGDTITLNVDIHSIAVDSIYGDNSVTDNTNDVQYTIVGITGYTYTWTISGGDNDPNPKTGQNSETITVDWGAAGPGSVQAVAVTGCGSASAEILTVTKYGNISSIASGDWNQTSTWSCTCVPALSDNVVIEANHTVTLVANTTIDNVTINSLGVVNNDAYILTVDGDYINNGTHTGDGGSNARIYLDGNTTNINGTGTIEGINQIRIQNNDKSIPSGANLTINDANIRLYDGVAITNEGIVTLEGGIFNISGVSSWINAANSTLKIGGVLLSSGTLISSAENNLIEYNGVGAQTITVPSDNYYNLSISTGGIKTLANNIDVNNTLTIGAGATLDVSGSNYSINLAGNWANSGTFNEQSGTLIFDGSSSIQTINTTGITTETFNAMQINSGAQLSLPAGKQLTLNGNYTNNGTFYIRADASSMASFIDNGTISGSGKDSIEFYLSGSAWHYVSQPVSVSTVNPIGGNYVKQYNENAGNWTNLTRHDNIEVMRGYTVKYFEGSRTNRFGGTANTGSLNYPLSYNGATGEGWHLIGNPYPSAIDWNASSGWTKTNIEGTIYYFDGTQYATWNGSIGTNEGTQYIPAMQGVFVNVTSAGAIGVTNAVRVHNPQTYWKKKSGNKNESETFKNLLKLKTSGGGYRDEIVVQFKEGATEEFDGDYDAERWSSYKSYIPELYTKIASGLEMSINVLPELAEDFSIELGFQIGTAGTYTIEAVDHEGFNPQSTIYLEDLYDTLMINIRDSAYHFYSDEYYDDDRFVLHFSPVADIVYEPIDSIVCLGNASAFHLTAHGSGNSYQWQKDAGGTWSNIYDDTLYSGTQNDTLLINSTSSSMDSVMYRCYVVNSNGSDTSIHVFLRTSENPVIVTSPSNQNVCGGSEAIFSVVSDGDVYDYSWQEYRDESWMIIIDGVSSQNSGSSLAVIGSNLNDNINYRCNITNVCGSVTSSPASLIVKDSYSIERDVNICYGDSALLAGAWQKTTGVYFDSLSTVLLCDSYIVSNLVINNPPSAFAGDSVYICNNGSAALRGSGGTSYEWSTSETSSTIIVSPIDTTNYILTVTDSYGCSDIDTVTVFVGNSLSFNLGDDIALCRGEDAILSVNTGIDYEWSPTEGLSDADISNPIASPDSTTIYTVIVEDGSGCSASDQIAITVVEKPIASADTSQFVCYGDSVRLYAGGGVSYLWSDSSITSSITVFAEILTEYTVTVTNSNGCTDNESVEIIVNSKININAGEDVSICYGDSTQLTVLGENSCQWSTYEVAKSIIVKPTISTLYTVTASGNNACTASDDVYVVVSQPDIPAVDDTTIVVGNSIPALVATGSNVKWYADAGLDSLLYIGLSYTPAVSEIGVYTFFLTDSLNACVSFADSVVFTIEALHVGITLLGEENAVRLYPNPARNLLNIAIDMPAQTELNITITNLENKEIYNKQLPATDAIQRIDLSDFSKGVYFVKITGDNYSKIEKLVVQ